MDKMTKPEVCRLCADFIGWVVAKSGQRRPYYDPTTSIEQAAGLKARLRELGYSYSITSSNHEKLFSFNIFKACKGTQGKAGITEWLVEGCSTVSEEDALSRAVAQMQKARE